MKTLYFDCSMGAAGDMLCAALWELVEDKQSILAQIESMGLPKLSANFVKAEKQGIRGTKLNVLIDGKQEHTHSGETPDILKEIGNFVRSLNVEETIKTIGKTVDDIITGLDTSKNSSSDPHENTHEQAHEQNKEHTHEHNHEHTDEHTHDPHYSDVDYHFHNSYTAIRDTISTLNLSDRVKKDVLEVYAIIAEAESHVHGVDMEHIHFHELGTMDALADIAIFCMLLERINPDRILASPINVGGGFVKCSHGIVPVPAPATALILKGVPTYQGKIKAELCTPTGAALLKHFVNDFVDMPCMTVEAIGYGLGEKDFDIANLIRVSLGNENVAQEREKLCELSCNIDDMSAERIGFAMSMLQKSGAIDVYTQPIGMKKNRPATMLTALCREQNKDTVIESFFKYTSTLGVRERELYRHVLHREISEIDSKFGKIRKKTATGYGVVRSKYEYEDLARLAEENNVSIEDIERELR